MIVEDVKHLPSGRIFLMKTKDGCRVEATEMQDVLVDEEVKDTYDPHIIWDHLVDHKDKWMLNVSTQKGCPHHCKFCDVGTMKFGGNLTRREIEEQVELLLDYTPHVRESSKVKIGFARMGEPAYNLENVMYVIESLPFISTYMRRCFNWLPCFNSTLPRSAPCIERVLYSKEKVYDGLFHFQVSCNSTNEDTRRELFGGADVLTIEEVVKEVSKHKITGRTVILNFIVMEGVEVNPKTLSKLGVKKNKFVVKLTPLNYTDNAKDNNLETSKRLYDLQNLFRSEGVPVLVDEVAKCEAAGLCCGQLVKKRLDGRGS